MGLGTPTKEVRTVGSIWVLGSMGWMPSAGQQTACVLVELGDELIMLDAGTGVANLAHLQDVLDRHDHLTILLSHFHLDHVAGLMYLKRFVAHKRVDVLGPARPAYPHTTHKYIADLLQQALYSSGPEGFARDVRYGDYGTDGLVVGKVRVGVRAQRHSAPSFELRLDDVLTYATDTRFDAAAWATYPHTLVLLHECWQVGVGDERHTSAQSLAEGLPYDTFDRVILIHQNPAWDESQRAEVQRTVASRGFELAHDGMHVTL